MAADARLEYDLLLYLADNSGRVLTRSQLLSQVWGCSVDSAGRTVDVHLRRLRAKLGGRGPEITTFRGIGYRMDRRSRVTVVRDPVAASQDCGLRGSPPQRIATS
jgi:DNA-binding response OmpR family regulator